MITLTRVQMNEFSYDDEWEKLDIDPARIAVIEPMTRPEARSRFGVSYYPDQENDQECVSAIAVADMGGCWYYVEESRDTIRQMIDDARRMAKRRREKLV